MIEVSAPQRQFDSILRRTIFLPLVLAAIVATLFVGQVLRLRSTARWVDHSDRAIAQMSHFERLMVDAESGVRGLLLHHDPKYLDSYRKALPAIEPQMVRLRELVADNPAQTHLLVQITADSEAWLELAHEALGRPHPASDPEQANRGKTLMDDLREKIDAFIGCERKLREQRAEEDDVSERAALVSGVVISILLALFLVTFTRRSLFSLSTTYRDAIRSRDDFLSIASHELKTPLTTLKLQMQMNLRLAERENGDELSREKIKRFITICLDQTVRLTGLVDELLDVTRIERGKLDYHFEELNLTQLVLDQIEQFSPQLRAINSSVKFSTTGAVRLNADPFRLKQVVVNLLTNAMKYGAGKPIDLAVSEEKGWAKLVIRDSGMGIPADKIALIFNRFERAVSSDKISGLGLGLFISKEIVSAHGGRIEVTSREGAGSTFTVLLPEKPRE